jgi:hypothetical protein
VTDSITIEVPRDDDWDAYSACLATAFAAPESEDERNAERSSYEPDRSLVARREGEIVGTAGITT